MRNVLLSSIELRYEKEITIRHFSPDEESLEAFVGQINLETVDEMDIGRIVRGKRRVKAAMSKGKPAVRGTSTAPNPG